MTILQGSYYNYLPPCNKENKTQTAKELTNGEAAWLQSLKSSSCSLLRLQWDPVHSRSLDQMVLHYIAGIPYTKTSFLLYSRWKYFLISTLVPQWT